MDNKIEIFQNSEFGELEVLKDGEKFFFPATECARKLGYADTISAIKRHCKGVVKHHLLTDGGNQTANFISEGDLYRLIVRSKLPSAERFESWVFDEVLPTIRKHGAYIDPVLLQELRDNNEKTARLIEILSDEYEKNQQLERENKLFKPKAQYYDLILRNPASVPVTMIAKDYGMSAQAFNRTLHAFGVQFKMRCTWELYQKYAQNGYTHTNIYLTPGGDSIPHTCWTQKGRLFLYELLKSNHILPTIELQSRN